MRLLVSAVFLLLVTPSPREVILAWLNPQGAWAITVSPPDLGSCLFLSGQLGSVRLLPKPEVKQ